MTGADGFDELDALVMDAVRQSGGALPPVVARSVARILDAHRVLVTGRSDNGDPNTLAAFADGGPQSNYPHGGAGTPCERVLAGETVHVEAAAPGESAYFGLPLLADDGEVLGHLCATRAGSLPVTPRQKSLCDVLATRLAAELQRRALADELKELRRRQMLLEARNQHLEDELRLLEREQIAGSGTRPALAPIDLDDNTVTGLSHVQREHILRVLDATHWVIEGNSGAALKLGMKPATLRHRMKKLGISRDMRATRQQQGQGPGPGNPA